MIPSSASISIVTLTPYTLAQDEALTSWLVGDAEELAAAALQLPALLDFTPSMVAAGTLCVARRAAGSFPVWPLPLAHATGTPPPPPHLYTRAGYNAPPCRSFFGIVSIFKNGNLSQDTTRMMFVWRDTLSCGTYCVPLGIYWGCFPLEGA